MKKTFLALIFMLSCSVWAQNNQEIFLQANQAYEQGDIQKAAMLYESVTNKGAAVWYNLGNCYYEQERFVDALVCWRRAQQQYVLPVYQAAQRNSDQLADKHNIESTTSLFDSFKPLAAHGSPLFWQMLFLVSWILLFVLFALRHQWLFLTVNGIFVVLLACMVTIKFNDLMSEYGIINDDATVFIGPGEHFTVQSKIGRLHEVIIKNKVDSWYNVIHAQGSGWISADKVSPIN